MHFFFCVTGLRTSGSFAAAVLRFVVPGLVKLSTKAGAATYLQGCLSVPVGRPCILQLGQTHSCWSRIFSMPLAEFDLESYS